jgi:PAS domain S-box-containing protein
MKILSVDDNTENLYLLEMMGRSYGYEVVSTRNGVEAIDRLAAEDFDLIVSDVLMPEMDGFQLCRTVKRDSRWQQIPFIFYTATYTAKQDEELGLALGASRFILKPVDPEEFMAVVQAVVRESESGNLPVPVVDLDHDSKDLSLYNQRLIKKLEHKIQQLEAARTALAAEIDQRRVAEAALKRSEEKFARAFLLNPAAIAIEDFERRLYLDVNDAFLELTGYSRDEVVGKNWDELAIWADPSSRAEAVDRLRTLGSLRDWEFRFRRKNGALGTGLLSAELIDIDGRSCAITAKMDITERLQLQNQLRQAQKLESIGRLAGGVAHDFNNLLTVISGYAEMLHHGETSNAQAIQEILIAAERASGLTRQLLAFSRRQMLQPQILNLSSSVQNITGMLGRLLGEDSAVVTNLEPNPWHVSADPGQIDLIIMNLAVNARDAMEAGGTITIRTHNVHLDDVYASSHIGVEAGDYVALSVSDTGTGMSEETRARLFEPFFTTKEVGRGTGLGLSTVYGIVKQSGGNIWVYSELGKGTTFTIYLPRFTGEALPQPFVHRTAQKATGDGTILIVEDDPTLRQLIADMLSHSGYRTLIAVDGHDALRICSDPDVKLDLIISDLVMPGLDGREIGRRALKLRPTVRILHMSGYSEHAVLRHDIFEPGASFIQKPFTAAGLASKVHELLDPRKVE